MRYHVNPETGKVSACRAKIKCRFGGASGKENHFDNRPDAIEASELILAEIHHDTNRLKDPLKRTVGKNAEFETKKKRIMLGLAKAGITQKLPEANSEDEIVQRWFNGDRSKYELIARISTPQNELQESAKNSVNGMLKKGASVSFVSDIETMSKVKENRDESLSQVDLIDEDFTDGKGILSDLASGKLVAFKK